MKIEKPSLKLWKWPVKGVDSCFRGNDVPHVAPAAMHRLGVGLETM